MYQTDQEKEAKPRDTYLYKKMHVKKNNFPRNTTLKEDLVSEKCFQTEKSIK